MKQTPLKRTRIKPMSEKRRSMLAVEHEARVALCERAGGSWQPTSRYGGNCVGGVCEKCHRTPDDFRGLSPHERVFRSHGGELSLANSEMRCGFCHSSIHGIREV